MFFERFISGQRGFNFAEGIEDVALVEFDLAFVVRKSLLGIGGKSAARVETLSNAGCQ